MALPIRRAGGGGFLNGVSGKLIAYEFDDSKTGVSKKGDPWVKLTVKLVIQADGAAKTNEQYFDAGFIYGDNAVSDDKQTLEGTENYALGADTEWGMFVLSLVEGEGVKMSEDALGDLRNFACIMGTRVTFARVTNEADTKRRGKRKYTGTDGKEREADRDNLLVTDVLSGPEPVKGAVKKAAAPKGKAATAATPSVIDTAIADTALRAILGAAADQTLDKTKLASSVIRYSVTAKLSGEDREALRKLLGSDDYLADAQARDLIVIDASTKGSPITLIPALAAA